MHTFDPDNIRFDFDEACRIVGSHPRNVATNWFVITGAPSSGKTTLLKLLAGAGYRTNPDMSRQFLEAYRDSGTQAAMARNDEAAFQNKLFSLMVGNAVQLPPHEVIIHDYALPDNMAFWENAGLDVPPAILDSARMFRYRGVFICEPLALDPDGIRIETRNDQLDIFNRIVKCYRGLGYEPILIPADKVQARLALILKNLPAPV